MLCFLLLANYSVGGGTFVQVMQGVPVKIFAELLQFSCYSYDFVEFKFSFYSYDCADLQFIEFALSVWRFTDPYMCESYFCVDCLLQEYGVMKLQEYGVMCYEVIRVKCYELTRV